MQGMTRSAKGTERPDWWCGWIRPTPHKPVPCANTSARRIAKHRRCFNARPADTLPTHTAMLPSTFRPGDSPWPDRPGGQRLLHGERRSRGGSRRPVNQAGGVRPRLYGTVRQDRTAYRMSTIRYKPLFDTPVPPHCRHQSTLGPSVAPSVVSPQQTMVESDFLIPHP